MILVQHLFEKGTQFNGGWNFGPRDEDAWPVQDVIDCLVDYWGEPAVWKQDEAEQPHEARSLKLDISKARQFLQWSPKWGLDQTISYISQWHSQYQQSADMRKVSLNQIQSYQHN